MNSNNETRFINVLEALSVLAKLTENKKLMMSNGTIDIDHRAVLQWVLRRYNKDKRNKCHEEVKKLFEESVNIAQSFLRDIIEEIPAKTLTDDLLLKRDKALRQYGRITNALSLALEGYSTQLVTYKEDDKHTSKVNVLIEQIKEELTDMEMRLQTNERRRLQQPQQHQTQNNFPSATPSSLSTNPIFSQHQQIQTQQPLPVSVQKTTATASFIQPTGNSNNNNNNVEKEKANDDDDISYDPFNI
jgi:hypothetical protein